MLMRALYTAKEALQYPMYTGTSWMHMRTRYIVDHHRYLVNELSGMNISLALHISE